MGMTRVQVRRDRPTALAWALALAVTMLVVYLLTLHAGGVDAVESVSAAPRVTREIAFAKLDGWCVSMARCDTQEEARLQACGLSARGAAGCAARLDGAWHALGALYDSEKDARRVAERLKKDAGVQAEVIRLQAEELRVRITASQAQIDAVAAADALLRDQTRQLGQIARQLDRGEIRADGAQSLCAAASTEAAEAAKALGAVPGAAENRLCAGLVEQLGALSVQLDVIARSAQPAASLSGMARCARIEAFLRQRELLQALGQSQG